MSASSKTVENLTPEARRALLARLLRERSDNPGPVPLSFAQQRLWFLDRLGAGAAYNVPIALRLTGPLDVPALEKSFTEIGSRHEALRTCFKDNDGQPEQVVARPDTISLPVVDLGRLPAGEREGEALRLAAEESARPFDLARGPLIRATLLGMEADEHVLLVTMHHIVSDGWSLGIFNRELAAVYNAFSTGRPSPVPPLPIQYGDFARWQRQRLQGDVLGGLLDYWERQLADLPAMQLRTDRPRPAAPRFRGDCESRLFPKDLSEGLRELAQREHATPFMVLLAAFQVLLQRYTGQQDIAVGSPIANRTRTELEGLIGFFVNTLVLRANAGGNPTFREYLGRVRETALGAYAHQDLPFEKLVEKLQPDRDLSRTPLVQAMITVQNAPMELPSLAGLAVTEFSGPRSFPLGTPQGASRFDLEVHAWDQPEGIRVTWIYSTDLFDAATIQRMLGHYERLLQTVVQSPDQRIAELPLLTDVERRQLLIEWNATDAGFPAEVPVHEMFEAQVARAPDALALEFEGESVTYGQLNDRANRLARYLASSGVVPGMVVGVCMERGTDLITSILAVLKAGAVYVPLDPGYPEARLRFMLQDAGLKIVLSHRGLSELLSGHSAKTIHIDVDSQAIVGQLPENLDAAATPDSLAYLIYTSGSTGNPKGALLAHRALCNVAREQSRLFGVGPGDRVLQFSSPNFDASIFEIVMALTTGATLVLAGREELQPGPPLSRLLRERRISILTIPPTSLGALDPEPLPDLRIINVAGEPCPPELVSRWAQGRDFYNLYGPTECTIWATAGKCVANGVAPHIGRPISNVRVYVLDPRGSPQPVGVAGELYIGGIGVGRGYLNRPELTRERFIDDRFSGTPGAWLYRTGDLARYLPAGAIEFLGRIDDQVKVRGFRIELGEIEAALMGHPAVREAVVVTREDSPGDKRVVAYVIANDGQSDALRNMRNALKKRLPEYMVPSVFVVLEKLPLTPNGKVDRKALPVPERSAMQRTAYIAPQSELEQRIAAVWREMLKLDQIGLSDNFFDLGGHSLLLVKTCDRLCAELQCELNVVDLFTYPTIEALAKHLGGKTGGRTLAKDALVRVKRRSGGSTQAEPIAIIGMAGRFPGARDIKSFWENLRQGKESITFFSTEETRESGVPDAVLNDPNYVNARGYLEDADKFDATFFGYSAREAENIDPQQRLLLECAAETLECAGHDPDRYDGLIGVYAGSSSNTYLSSMPAQKVLGSADGLSTGLAGGRDFLTTRVSYKLNLRGPSVNIQTACSTSLVAVHQACQALRDHECDMALAGGVSVTMPLKSGHIYMPEGICSRDGHCRAFDSEANGTVAGNGVALVLLKRLSEALADGDKIHAVIRGTAINNDGSSKVGYAAPSVEGQAQAIALAQASAQCDPDTIDYVETHGTGTLLGDPIEVAALTRVFGDGRTRRSPCWIGSVKTSVGHLDAAAGVAGLIKGALSLEHKELVPSLNFKQPNPKIDFASALFKVNTELRKWESPEGAPRRAGVSSFGFGGTNAHVVLEEAPAPDLSGPSRGWQLLCLSAKTDAALAQAKANLARHLSDHFDINLGDAAYTLQIGRREFSHRCVVVCQGVADAAAALGSGASVRVIGSVHKGGGRSVVFMFSGQGAQYPDMGLGLYRTEAVFRETIDQCCVRLKSRLGLELREVLFPDEGSHEQAAARLKQTELTQPALFVIEYALAKLLMSLGIQPAAMIGHSVGEYVAACLAGVMSLEDALDLVAERGRLMGQLPPGSMMAIPLSEAQVLPLLSRQLSIASINSPNLCVVSGPEAGIAALEARLVKMDLAPRRLHTSHAFHSSMMAPILEPFTKRVSAVVLNRPRVPYISNVTGEWITAEQATDPAYYAAHLRQTVQFAKGLEQFFADPNRVFLEVGPGHTLTALARRHPAKRDEHAFVPSMRHPDESRADEEVLMESMGRLWLAGAPPDWLALHAGHRRRRVSLPTYPFQQQKYWLNDGKEHEPAGALRALKKKPDIAEWFYVPSWKQTASPTDVTLRATGPSRWLLFADKCGWAEKLARRLTGEGDAVVMVHPGRLFEERSDFTFTIDPGNAEHYETLFAALANSHGVPTRIAHLWSVTGNLDENSRGPGEEQFDRSFWSPTCVAKALGRVASGERLEINFVSDGLQEVTGDERLCPEKATILGPCRVIPQEYPGIVCRSVDVVLPEANTRGERLLLDQLCAELRSAPANPLVAYRGVHRWVRTYEPVRIPALEGRPSRLRNNGVYLITGGLGGIGLAIAEYLAAKVSARLVLVSRTRLPEANDWNFWLRTHADDDKTSEKIRRIRGLEKSGAQVMVASADVANRDEMLRVVEMARERFGQIHGVVHSAGVPAGGIIELKTLEATSAILAPKLQGTMVLNDIFADVELDFVVLCSSLAAVLGGGGQVDYTAANAFLDAFAQAKARNERRFTVSIAWDTWSETGMAVETEVPANLVEQRLQHLEAGIRDAEGMDVFGRVLDCSLPQVAVSTRDLQGRIEQWTGQVDETDAAKNVPAPHRHPRPALSSVYEAPRNDAERLLADVWREMFGIDQVGIHDNFFELGGDSVLNIQITAKANQAGLKVTPKQTFEHQTIAALAAVAGAAAAIVRGQDSVAPRPKAESSADVLPGPQRSGISESDLAEIGRQLGKQAPLAR